MFINFWLIIFCMGIFLVAAPFVLYPLLTALLAAASGKTNHDSTPAAEHLPSVSFIIVVHNGATLLPAKINNFRKLDYPEEKLNLIVFSDGSTDHTEELMANYQDSRIIFLKSNGHQGKPNGLNTAVAAAAGEALVFSDTDASLAADSLKKLLKHHEDNSIGGACGQIVILKHQDEKLAGQAEYARWDNRIKQWENSLGAVTSNTGKLYWMRRELYRGVPEGTMDDLFNCLDVIRQGKQFLFVREALAFIPAPARTAAHEIERRRRIVRGSLLSIWLNRSLFNPLAYGTYGLRLMINKILRRLMPVGLVLTLVSSGFLIDFHPPAFRLVFGLQTGFYILAAVSPIMESRKTVPRLCKRVTATAFYFCLGNLGMLLGIVDFLQGKRSVKWTPRKP